MSAYNAEKYISEAIESILNQTFKNFEFIIIEDKSTDKTKKIVQTYAKKDPRILPIYKNKNEGYLGFIKNLNLGIKNATGKYIARMDADDVALPLRLEKQHSFLEKNKSIFLVGTGAIIINKKGDKISEFNPIFKNNKLKKQIHTGGQIYHPTIMFRNDHKTFYREKALFSEDLDLYLRLITNKKILINIPQKLLKYRIVSTSICHKHHDKQYLFSEKMLEFYQQRLNNKKEGYSKFNPEKILKSKSKQNEKELLKLEIRSSFGLEKYNTTKKLGKIFFRKYGYDKVLIYLLISYLGNKIIKIIRKINIIYKKLQTKIK